jgi:membrane protein implicated in regulation of membrane protease activity
MKRLTIAAILSTLATPLLAHPGHDAAPATHWVADLPHLAVTLSLAGLAVVAFGVLRAGRRARARRKTE